MTFPTTFPDTLPELTPEEREKMQSNFIARLTEVLGWSRVPG